MSIRRIPWIAKLVLRIFINLDWLAANLHFRRPVLENRVLLVRTDHIGDFVLWQPAASALVNHYRAQGMRCVLIANAAWASLPVVTDMFDQVIPVGIDRMRQDLRYRLSLIRAFSRLGARVVVNCGLSRDASTSDSLVRAVSAPLKITGIPEPHTFPRTLGSREDWYDRVIPVASGRTELEMQADLVEAIVGRPPAMRFPALALRETSELPEALRGKRFAVIAPGCSSSPLRTWPASAFARLAERIEEVFGIDVVLLGSPSERHSSAEVARLAGVPVTDLTGLTSLADLTRILASAAFVVSNETGTAHLAAALGTPAITITGGGHFGRCVPWDHEGHVSNVMIPVSFEMSCFHCNWSCIHPRGAQDPAPCVRDIKVDAVWSAVLATLQPGSSCASLGKAE